MPDTVLDIGPKPAPETRELQGKRLLIIVENLPVPFDRRVWQEATTLQEAGATVSIICPTAPGYEARYELRDGVHIHRHPLYRDAASAGGYLLEYGIALFWQTLLAWRIFFGRGFDVLQVCNPPDLGFVIALQFRWLGRRYIFDHHDINPELYEAKFGKRGLGWKLISWAEKLNFRFADVVISTNNSYRSIAMRRGGVAEADVFVVRSGPNLARLKQKPPVESLKQGRKHLIGYVGVMGEQEGIDLLLEAARHIVLERGRQDIGFCLVGGGSSLKPLQAMAQEMGLGDYVHFTGRAPDDVLFGVLSTADVCVNPDRVNPMNDQSTMNKVLEYMAFGKAQVQFDVKEGRFSAGEASLYARPNDALDMADKILHLIDNPELREQMGRYGRARVEAEFSWDRQKAPLIAAYWHALSKGRARAATRPAAAKPLPGSPS